MIICADSQCLTFVIDAMQGLAEPKGNLAGEMKALFQTYLYLPGTLHSTPSSKSECLRIPDPERRELHRRFLTANFDVVRPPDPERVRNLVESFCAVHSGKSDCFVLAEAIEGGADVLLTYDYRFLSRLANLSRTTRMLQPSEFWSTLNIPRGSKPDKVPHNTNPMSNENWWIW